MEFITSTMENVPDLEDISGDILNDFVNYLRKKPKNQNHPFAQRRCAHFVHNDGSM